MDIQAPYYRQVALLMQVLPYVAVEREFALKGVQMRCVSLLLPIARK